MFDNQEQVKKKIEELHSGDIKQLEAIFSEAKKLIIEAPAGYGKTKTMISTIAYLIASKQLLYPKKVLALTFSVNSAIKIKNDIALYLPNMLGVDINSTIKLNEKVFISNYHGFCRHFLKLYGYLMHENLVSINSLSSVDDSSAQHLNSLDIGLSLDEINLLTRISEAIKSYDIDILNKEWLEYTNIVLNKFITNNFITYNAIILLVIKCLVEHPTIKEFYQKFFPIIIVDEFQDTNAISWRLLRELTNEKTRLILMGDSLQRIYGFIGAIPSLLSKAQKIYEAEKIQLEKNYRFKDNPQMLLLDKNIRANAENPSNPEINESARIPYRLFQTQIEESSWVAEKIWELIRSGDNVRIAILVQQRSSNIEVIMDTLSSSGVDYFFGLFRDDDSEYIRFHMQSLLLFRDIIKNKATISKVLLSKFYKMVKDELKDQDSPTYNSLLALLQIFINKIGELVFLTSEEKTTLIIETLENRALKQNMEHVSSNVLISTVHGAKGLEWDYVILPDMEQFLFPNYPSLCGMCRSRFTNPCEFILTPSLEDTFLAELSVFYVAVTRARKQVFFSGSKYRLDRDGNEQQAKPSCLVRLPGIVLDEEE
ncbi:MAG: ATP-dependent helicase [Clostridiales bacterium]|jgi:DNA helicase-2/ATP-dependent DNA helicase PcrA|nr:ATP-dependent helicase [Clostridiales bacterium]